MFLPAMRPPFSLQVSTTRAETIQRLSAGLQTQACGCVGGSSSGHVSLHICDAERRLFSPTLDVEVRELPSGGAALSGRYGPHPHIWTLYVALYALLFFLCVGGGVFGLSQWVLGQMPTAWLAFPVALVLGAGLYGSAFVGQRMAAHQMEILERFLRENLDPSAWGEGA